jgi:hypothetical protein
MGLGIERFEAGVNADRGESIGHGLGEYAAAIVSWRGGVDIMDAFCSFAVHMSLVF